MIRHRTLPPLLLPVLLAALAPAPGHAAGALPPVPLEVFATGLQSPLAIRNAGDGSGRVFIVEQVGTIRVAGPDGSLRPEPFLDLGPDTGPGLTEASGERGLLGLAFHPDYADNGLLFVNYTDADPGNAIPDGTTVIARYAVDPQDPDRADPASGQVVLTVAQDFGNHNGGDLHFGPDGDLYIGMGDGGSGGDPNDRAQAPRSLLGKMLRIDVDRPGENVANACGEAVAYGIPADNPFAGSAEVCPETWALGLRNPFRFSFDAATGDLWIGDVGQRRLEEINRLPAGAPAGANFGWDCREGDTDYGIPGDPGGPSPACFDPLNAPLVEPVIVYGRDRGCSVTGGYRYRGPVPAFHGVYFASDFCDGVLLLAREEAGGGFQPDFQGSVGNPAGFGEDEDLALYVADLLGGVVYRVDLLFGAGFETAP